MDPSREVDANGPLALAVLVAPVGEVGAHAGLMYETGDGAGFSVLHLGWQFCLLQDGVVAWPRALFARLHVGKEDGPAISSLCRRIFQRSKGSIPYAVKYLGGSFQIGNADLLLNGGNGLTCATFVLAVLRGQNIEILDWAHWGKRADDPDWHVWVVSNLQKSGADASHVAAVRAEKDFVRIRPLDVFSGAKDYPAGAPLAYGAAEAERAELEGALNALRSPL